MFCHLTWTSRCCGCSPDWPTIPEGTPHLPFPHLPLCTLTAVPGVGASPPPQALAHLLHFLHGFCSQSLPLRSLQQPSRLGSSGGCRNHSPPPCLFTTRHLERAEGQHEPCASSPSPVFLQDPLAPAAATLWAPPQLSPPCPFLSFLSTCPELQSWGPTCLGAISDLVKTQVHYFLPPWVGAPPRRLPA